jgi:hypothetical protein
MPPETMWLVRAEGKDPLDKPVSTVLMKDHRECTAVWAARARAMEEMHAINDCDC